VNKIREEIKKFSKEKAIDRFTERDLDTIMSWTDAHLIYLLTGDYYLNREIATLLIKCREDK